MQESILRRLVLITFLMSIVGYSEKSWGYEFSMTGIMTWKYASYSQLGSNGFFGPFDTDASDVGPALDNYGGSYYGGSIGSAASMNGWLGHEMQSVPTLNGYGEISSGSDLSLATFYMTICPELRLTQALRIRGSYRIGSWETPYAPTSRGSMVRSEYPEGMAPGVQRSFSPGYWETLWASLQVPWGIVVFGKRPGPFGLGVMFDGNDNADAVGIMLMTNYGPFRVGLNVAPWLLGSPYYYTLSDKNAVRQFDLGAGMTYDSGPISSGLGGHPEICNTTGKISFTASST